MRKPGIILSSLSVLLLSAFIAGSTGFTVVTHECKMCGVSSIKTELIYDKSAAIDPCCDNTAVPSDNSQMNISAERCCNFQIEQLKITNYLPVVYFAPDPDLMSISDFTIDITPVFRDQQFAFISPVNEKYGGKSILSLNHQLII